MRGKLIVRSCNRKAEQLTMGKVARGKVQFEGVVGPLGNPKNA
jgi:hypothetical protein